MMVRGAHLAGIRTGSFDMLVIGGGITGAGVALDAAARGLSVALVERGDFASGTSSASTKLVHGGVRYLPMLDIAQVREGLEEQTALLRNAPHLVRPLPFVLPLYRDARRPLGLDLPAVLRAGLPLGMAIGLGAYDLLAGRHGARRHRRIDRDGAAALAPPIRLDGLRCAYLYYDSQTDDARLTVAVLQTAAGLGALTANYVEAVGIRHEAGRISGVHLLDRTSGERFTARARTVINATGVWAEAVARFAGPPAFRIRRAKGVHLVCSNARLGMRRAALVLPETDDGRIAFIVPWRGVLILGTTDTEWDRGEDDPEITPADVAYLLDHASRFLSVPIDRQDLVGAYAGLRPLISSDNASSAHLSRRHGVVRSGEGFYSIIGGKLTTFRRMAEDVVNAATGRRRGTPSPTWRLPLTGAEGLREAFPGLRARARRFRFSRATFLHLIQAYGTEMGRVLDLVEERPALGRPLVAGLPPIAAEVVTAVRQEMAVNLADVMLRRTRLTHLLADQGAGIAAAVAALMGGELGWPEEMRSAQVADYARTAARFGVPRAAAAAQSAPAARQTGPGGSQGPRMW
jgi:glycerol-3-phosphate dehydrogenase